MLRAHVVACFAKLMHMAIVKVLTKGRYLAWECMGSLGMRLGYPYYQISLLPYFRVSYFRVSYALYY